MPELPEVEFARRVCEQAGKGHVISRCKCTLDPIVYTGASTQRVQRHLRNNKLIGVHRYGKYLWWEMDRGPYPVFHLGMTGNFRIKGEKPLTLKTAHEGDDWPPRFTKLLVTFDHGESMAFTNARRLGRIRLLSAPMSEPPISKLGFDPLLHLPTLTQFKKLVARRKTNLKSLLLDQSFAAGVGNWIADEVLYQARLSPKRRVNSLSDDELKRVRYQLSHVVKRAVKVDADSSKFPRTWLFHHRWDRGRKGPHRTARGETIRFSTIAGRTTAWVPSRQH